MSISLTSEQLHTADAAPIHITDEETSRAYVVVRAEVYERLKTLLALDEYDPDSGASHVNEIMADDDAHDPYLASYQQYRRPG